MAFIGEEKASKIKLFERVTQSRKINNSSLTKCNKAKQQWFSYFSDHRISTQEHCGDAEGTLKGHCSNGHTEGNVKVYHDVNNEASEA